jgi:phospholipid/cholesterol/gamma-HCH transport system substrate-binding protein
MAKKAMNNVKLGAFVLAGLVFLVVLLYMIGRNQNMFGSNFILIAHFENVQGLKAGNNVRYGGIDVGTVKKINILNDTMMEVVMTIDEKMKSIIHKNALASIGTDGLVGNKVVNMVSAKQPSSPVEDGDIIATKSLSDMDEMLETLDKTNNDINIIAGEMKTAMQRVNNSDALWGLLEDKELPQQLKASVANIRLATLKANSMVNDLNSIVHDVKSGKGSAGVILTDTTLVYNLNTAILKMKTIGDSADALLHEITTTVSGIKTDINSGKGPVSAMLKDSVMTAKISSTLDNIQEGTDGFNETMEALRHSFLLRGAFRKLDKQKEKEKKEASDTL